MRKNCAGGFGKKAERLKVIYDPTIAVFHHGGVIAKKSEHIQKSVDYFLDKHFRHRFGYRFFKLLNRIIH